MSTHQGPVLTFDPDRIKTPEARRETIRSVRWALVIACAYLVLFSDAPTESLGSGGIVVAVFLASNLVLGRIPARAVGTPQFNVALALMDVVLIGASLYFAGQLSVELVVLCLGVLVLAIAGLSPGAIALGTIALALCYLIIIGVAGGEPLLRSGTLLRVPFLLSTAIVYAWLVELGRGALPQPSAETDAWRDLAATLQTQREAIERCQAELAENLHAAAEKTLREIASVNQDLSNRVARHLPLPATEHQGHGAPAVAPSAA